MKIEIGKTYTTKNGFKVEIVGQYVFPLNGFDYMGVVLTAEEKGIVAHDYYNESGKATISQHHSIEWKPTVLRRHGVWWPTNTGDGPSLHVYKSEETMTNDILNMAKSGKKPVAGPILIETEVYL